MGVNHGDAESHFKTGLGFFLFSVSTASCVKKNNMTFELGELYSSHREV